MSLHRQYCSVTNVIMNQQEKKKPIAWKIFYIFTFIGWITIQFIRFHRRPLLVPLSKENRPILRAVEPFPLQFRPSYKKNKIHLKTIVSIWLTLVCWLTCIWWLRPRFRPWFSCWQTIVRVELQYTDQPLREFWKRFEQLPLRSSALIQCIQLLFSLLIIQFNSNTSNPYWNNCKFWSKFQVF